MIAAKFGRSAGEVVCSAEDIVFRRMSTVTASLESDFATKIEIL